MYIDLTRYEVIPHENIMQRIMAANRGGWKKDFPADKALINWLWQHPEVREELWNRMKEKSD